MEIGDAARGVLLSQALGTMVMTEAEVTGAVHRGDEIALEAEIIQGFHADKPLGVPAEQLGESGAADVSDKMIQGLGDRQGVLLGARQKVEVVEDGAFQVAQVVIGRAAAAQAQAKQEQPPPAEKTTMILDHRLEAGVGQLVEPTEQFREEMADGFEEGSG